MILYIHGFRAKGNGEKATMLRDYFRKERVISPSLKHKPEEDIEDLKTIIKKYWIEGEKVIVVGSSLGGFYAYYLSVIFNIPCILINPCFNPWEALKGSLGVNTLYGSEKIGDETKETFELKPHHLGELKMLGNKLDAITKNDTLNNFFISCDDEVINHSETLLKFKGCNIKLFDKAGHTFTKFDRVLPDIEKILKN